MNPYLSIVIPTHGRRWPLERLLASIERQVLDRKMFEVLVVHNLPGHELNDSYSYPFRQLCSRSLGVNRARNLGAEAARGELILFLDDDTELLTQDLLAKHIDLHRSNLKMDGLGGTYLLPNKPGLFAQVYHIEALSWLSRFVDKKGQSPYLLGGHTSYKKKVFQEGYKFNEDIVFGGAETDFNWRLTNSGKCLIFNPELAVIHHVDIGLRGLLRKAFLQTKHARERKAKLGEPTALLAMEESRQKVLHAISFTDHSIHFSLALWLYRFAAQLGWKCAGESCSWRIRILAKMVGANA